MKTKIVVFLLVLFFIYSCKSNSRVSLKDDAITTECSKDKFRFGMNFMVHNTTNDTFELKYAIGSRHIPIQIISPGNDTSIINEINISFSPEQYSIIAPDSSYIEYSTKNALGVDRRGLWKFQISMPELNTSSSCEVEFVSEHLQPR